MKNKKEKYMYITIGIVALILIVIGVSYALWIMRSEQKNENILSTSCLNVTMEDEIDSIDLKKTQPILDEEGLNLKPFSFKIKNNCEEYADYTINLEMLSETTLESKYVKIALSEKGDKGVATKLDAYKEYEELKSTGTKEGRQLKSGKLKPSEEKDYELRIWLDEDVTVEDDTMGKMYKSKIIVESEIGEKPYTESILNGTDPVLEEGLIPITINEENGSVTRADETEKWYSYSEQQWANAVILRDGVEDPGANKPIDEGDIESYFVWIPKFQYKIFDMGEYNEIETVEDKNNKAIEIKFGLDNTVNDNSSEEYLQCETPMQENKIQGISGHDENCNINYWMTHPAFLSFNTNGLWVGKFETGYDGATADNEAQVNNIEVDKIVIKPNVFSWGNISVGKIFKIGLNYQRTLDSHAMKNTEWGAVAYLTQSNYGRCKNNSCEEIMINNSRNAMTGFAAKSPATVGYDLYLDGTFTSPNVDTVKAFAYPRSIAASTTGNVTGIFDMNGGLWEYVMGNANGEAGLSELSKNIELISRYAKYFDVYDSNDFNEFNKRILGDATGEMGPFGIKNYNGNNNKINSYYEDWGQNFATSNEPWFIRGGHYFHGTHAGIFAFQVGTGENKLAGGFRLVLAF